MQVTIVNYVMLLVSECFFLFLFNKSWHKYINTFRIFEISNPAQRGKG